MRSKLKAPLDGTVIFSGTLGTLTAGFIYAEQFKAQLIDPRLDRRLELSYNVCPLDYLNVE